jgi:hypothetical protein
MVIFVHHKKKTRKNKLERKEILRRFFFVTHLDEKLTMTLSLSMLIIKKERDSDIYSELIIIFSL